MQSRCSSKNGAAASTIKISSDMEFICVCGKAFLCRENREAHIANAKRDGAAGVHQVGTERKLNLSKLQQKYIPIAEFRLHLRHSRFVPKQTLFVLIVDKSGSMSGSPWRQVQSALIHILGVTKPNKLIRTEIVVYSSTAKLTNPTTESIKALRAGGGTKFVPVLCPNLLTRELHTVCPYRCA